MNREQYKVWKLPHPLLLHWVLNPAMAINELVLGQRVPKEIWLERASKAPLVARQHVPCPHCHAIHSGQIWSGKRAFGNWFGLICPQCHQQIPCLWGLTSLVVLALTLPLWIWLWLFARQPWQRWQIKRLNSVPSKTDLRANWLRTSILFTLLLFAIQILPGLGEATPSTQAVATQALVALLGGLAFALLWRRPTSKKR